MKQAWLFLVFVVAVSSAQDVSCRMRSLGDDFVLLIPDQETDVWHSAVFMTNSVVGVHFNQGEMPVSFRAFTRRVGVTGMYWPHYVVSLDSGINKRFTVEDRLKLALPWLPGRVGILLSPDVSRSLWKRANSTGYIEHDRNQSFMLRASVGMRVSGSLYVVVEPAYGLWEKYHAIFETADSHQDVHIPTGRVSLLYRRLRDLNSFTTAFLRCGGPVAIDEVDGAGVSPFIYLQKREEVFRPFANSAAVAFGLARGLPISDQSSIVLGIRENARLARASTAGRFGAVDSIKIDFLNQTVLPIATEYVMGRVSVRFGAGLSYRLSGSRKQTELRGVRLVLDSDMVHSFGYGYSFGLGWRPGPRLTLDFHNSGNLAYIRDWACQLTYVF